MDYLNFDIRIGVADNRGYPINVIQSPTGEASAILQLALDELTFRQSLQALEEVRHSVAISSERAIARRVGTALFDALFAGEVRGSYRGSLARARDQGKRLRIRLRIEAPELAVLPWELLYDDSEGDHISLLRETPLTRYLDVGRPADPLTIQPPIRILAMVASPRELPPLDTEQERARMVTAIDHLIESRTVELVWVEGQTWRDLDRSMQSGDWHIFHFIGHGGFDSHVGEGMIALVDESTGEATYLSATQLGRLFAAYPSLRLAVLNACEGARASEYNIFSSTGATLARRGIPAVISMQFTITDKASIEFSRAFYDSLARGLPVDAAVQEARFRISMTLADSTEWGTPVLYMRTGASTLFHVDVTSAIFRGASISPTPQMAKQSSPTSPIPDSARETHRHLEFIRKVLEQQPTPPAVGAVGEKRRGLEILLRKVRRYWIDGVLEKSLFQVLLLDLGMILMPEAVENPWGSLLERPGAESQPLAPGQTLADVFEEEGSSLLILGEPGSGKTTYLLQLARSLLARSEEDSSRPVPVVFNLSGWVAPYTTLTDWVVSELSVRYQIPKKIGQEWLAEGWLLPMLDGLDELDSQRQAECVWSINEFVMELGLVGAVVCCRLHEYIALPIRLSLNSAVRLLPLTDEQVDGYLVAAGEHLTGLRQLLERDSALRIESRSPLMFSLMSRAYQDVSVNQIANEEVTTIAFRRKQLMDAYVAHMFRRVAQKRKI